MKSLLFLSLIISVVSHIGVLRMENSVAYLYTPLNRTARYIWICFRRSSLRLPFATVVYTVLFIVWMAFRLMIIIPASPFRIPYVLYTKRRKVAILGKIFFKKG